MPSWKFTPPNTKEATSAFDLIKNLANGKETFLNVSKRFNITTVLIPRSGQRLFPDSVGKLVDVLLGIRSRHVDFVKEIKESGMKLVYHDSISQVYSREITKHHCQ